MPPKVIGKQGQGWDMVRQQELKLHCFGQYILDGQQQFGGTGDANKDLEQLQARIDQLSVYDEGQIVAVFGGEAKPMTERKSIWKVAENGTRLEKPEFTPVLDASEKYGFMNHTEQMGQVVDMLKEHQVHFRGFINEVGGQMRGRLIFEDPNFKVPILTLFDDYVNIELSFQNSVDGTLRFGGEGGGVRMRCSNMNQWGDLLGAVYGRHVGKVQLKFQGFLNEMLVRAERLPDVGDRAFEDQVDPSKIVEFMTGSKLPDWLIPVVVNDLTNLEPMIVNEKTFNRFTIYNATTAWVTRQVGLKAGEGEKILSKATDMLTLKTSDAIKKGERIIEERLEKEEEERNRAQFLAVVQR